MDVERFDVELADGRLLEVWAAGPPGGTMLLAHHGTPSDGSIYAPVATEAAARGLRWVSYSRPGYAGSTRHEGRSVADCAADALAVADRLGVQRFFTVGSSGGGPHALASAALLPERVIACATVAGVGPSDVAGLDFLEGMAQENVDEFGAALDGPGALGTFLEHAAEDLDEVSGTEVAAALGGLVSEPDVAALTGEYAVFMASTLRAAISRGIDGWFDDDIAFTRAWGFELSSIRVPVRVWQGEQDRMVPVGHGRWLAEQIPGARAEIHQGDGHLSLGLAHVGEICDALLEDGGSR